MASVYLYVNPNYAHKERASVSLQITHLRKVKFCDLKIDIDPRHWDFDNHQLRRSHPEYQRKNSQLTEKLSIGQRAIEIVADRAITADGLKAYVTSKLVRGFGPLTLQEACNDLVTILMEQKKTKWANHISNNVKWFNEWIGEDKPLTEIDSALLHRYKDWNLNVGRKGKGNTENTVISYLSAIRKVFSHAKKKMKAFPYDPELWPFDDELFPEPNESGKEQEYDISVIQKLEELAPNLKGAIRRCVDFTLLQFYLGGPDFVELAMAIKSQIEKGYFVYKRYKNRSGKKAKSAPTVRVKISDKAYLILAQYNHEYLLMPVLDGIPTLPNGKPDKESYQTQYETRYGNHMRELKKVSKMIGVELSSKSMRYLTSSRATELNISIKDTNMLQGRVTPEMKMINRYNNNPKVKKALQDRVDAANDKIQKF